MADNPPDRGIWSAVLRTRQRVVGFIALAALLYAAAVAAIFVLAQQNEQSRFRAALDAEAAEAAQGLRSTLLDMQGELEIALAQSARRGDAEQAIPRVAVPFLERHAQALRIERRDLARRLLQAANSEEHDPGALAERRLLDDATDVACQSALRQEQSQYSQTFYVPRDDGLGIETIDLCIPVGAPAARELWVLSLSLGDLLRGMDPTMIVRHGEVHLSDADGTRLVTLSRAPRGRLEAASQALIALPGTTLQFGVASRLAQPLPFPGTFALIAAAFSLLLFVSVLFVARDVLRRQRAEAALSQSLSFRRAMEDSLLTGLRARDLDGRITYVNPAFCEIVGLPAERLIGSAPPQPYWPPESRGEYEQRLARRRAGSSTREVYETELMRPDGSRVPVSIHEAPLVDARGRHSGWMASVLDLTEQRRVEAVAQQQQRKLAEASRMTTLGELASTLSHELNQPLAAIASLAAAGSNMARAGAPPGELLPLLDDLAAQAERAGRVIKSVRNFVRRSPVQLEALDLGAVLTEVLPLIQLQARTAGASVSHTIAPGLPAIRADRTLLEQVLLNLTRNGFEAMAGSPAAERRLQIDIAPVTADGEPIAVQVRVADRGHGIDERTQRELFTPFHSTKAGGLGLGLNICRSVVEHYGGRLWFESAPAGGTIFAFTLPADRGEGDHDLRGG
jgi:two-component system sensor histidine kinase DctS